MNNFVELDCVAVKGKKEGVRIYTIAETAPEHEQYLNAYYSGDWDSATVICKNLAEQSGDLQHYYELMLDRLTGGCPANWDGIFKATSK